VLMLPQDGPAVVFTVMLRLLVRESAVGVVESVTVTEKGVLPAVVGVPLITPAADRVNPAGKAVPLARVKVYGATPPVAVRVVE
jgi:hypothetical protein